MGWWQDFWNIGGNLEQQRTRGRADYERRQAGEGERPWWLSQQEWERRGDRTAARQQFQQAQSDFNTWKNDFNLQGRIDDYNAKLAALQSKYDTDKPTWNPTQWSDYQGRYQGSMDRLADLMARQSAGPTTTDEQETFDQMARLYGMTPEQFREMQAYFNVAPGSEAQLEQQKRIRDMANELSFGDTEGNAQFDAMLRSQQRAAEAGMGKQLETIFADRGGLGGFAAAQDYTLQMSNAFMQQRSQYMLEKQREAVEAINADINRKFSLVQSGQQTARDLLNDRWANLQQSIQNQAAMAQQVLDEFTTVGAANRADYETNVGAFATFFNMQKDIILTQLGIDQATMDMYQKMYDMQIAPYLDMWATSA